MTIIGTLSNRNGPSYSEGEHLKQPDATVDTLELMHEVTMTVNLAHARQFGLRLKIACWLIALGARVLNCQIKFESTVEE